MELAVTMSSAKRPIQQNIEPKQAAKSSRDKRLEVLLRANLKKRKEQARQRQEGKPQTLPKG